MPNKMLIDSSHPEETRVVVVRGSRIEEFDFESQDKKQLRGNIYLARVTRVEPSLQAAFVEYGGNRHGFLAFSEIHPDYYQIPVADRQAILRAEAEEARAEEDGAEDEEREDGGRGRKRRRAGKGRRSKGQKAQDQANEAEDGGGGDNGATPAQAAEAASDTVSDDARSRSDGSGGDGDEVDTVGAEDALDEAHHRRRPVRRNYKIQEVIKRRQILLVQVVKEERGNKGAALTTYLSLAGRYSVLMPNTARGGGISRKITNPQDRKRLKDVVRELEVPEGMGVILRTAGANRTKAEVKRDYDYLMRLWERVRNLTLESSAPALVYEEGSLIKRSVRDLYNKDIDQILVAGEEGYREAKDFMRMLMPSHAKVVQPYRDTTPIFARNGIDAQLDRMVQPQVTLKSGGYIIINQTEALVAIDVNSGRSTKEHSIEDTALQTNLEAAEEVARQLRLRDLAGLIVIDYIDMEENRNNRAVEKKLKECLKNDRARIQVGRISHFGLLEMSRQRIRASVLESTMQTCVHCGGTGHVRSESSVALLVVRAIEEYLLKDSRNDIVVRTPPSTALYVLNHKRANIATFEDQFGVTITIASDDEIGSQYYAIDRGAPSDRPGTLEHGPVQTDFAVDEDEDEAEAEPETDTAHEAADEDDARKDGEDGRKKRRRRRRRGGRDREKTSEHSYVETAATDLEGGDAADDNETDADRDQEDLNAEADQEGRERKKRRRGKRGGKRNRRDETASDPAEAGSGSSDDSAQTGAESPDVAGPEEMRPAETEGTPPAQEAPTQEAPAQTPASDADLEPATEAAAEEKPKKKPARSRRKKAETKADSEEGSSSSETEAAPSGEQPAADTGKAAAANDDAGANGAEEAAKDDTPNEPVVSSDGDAGKKPRKTGWWQRKSFF